MTIKRKCPLVLMSQIWVLSESLGEDSDVSDRPNKFTVCSESESLTGDSDWTT
jgi:hypothetical protein